MEETSECSYNPSPLSASLLKLDQCKSSQIQKISNISLSLVSSVKSALKEIELCREIWKYKLCLITLRIWGIWWEIVSSSSHYPNYSQPYAHATICCLPPLLSLTPGIKTEMNLYLVSFMDMYLTYIFTIHISSYCFSNPFPEWLIYP